MADEDAFLAAIAANNDDEASRLVYADWLEAQDDPRGEWLRLEAQLYAMMPRFAALEQALDPAWVQRVQRRQSLVLVATGARFIECIRSIREITGFGLAEAKRIADDVRGGRPRAILDGVSPHVAARWVRELSDIGADARACACQGAMAERLPHALRGPRPAPPTSE